MKTAFKLTLAASAVALLAACGGGGGGENTAAPSANTAPVANAGQIQNILVAATVTLNGSNSSDANNDALTYIWTLTSKPAGSTATLSSATSAMPTFTADVAGAYVASLVVNDGKENSTVSTVTVNATVANAAPVANAGTAQNVTTNSVVTLNGSNSSDANGDALTYSWTLTSKPSGSSATLSSATSAMPTFTADVAGSYLASLVVNDGKVSSTASTVTVNASVANAAPVANAGTAQNVSTGVVVMLNGSNSSDANGDALTYSWTLTSKPAGSSAVLNNATSAMPTFTADVAGAYVASLVVNDGKVSSNTSTVSINAVRQPITLYEREFNDDYVNATRFNLEDTVEGSLSSANDVDWFEIPIETGGMVSVTFDASSMNFGSFNVYWYAPDMMVMSGRNIGGGTGTSPDQMKLTYSFPAFQKGIYKVRVQPSFSALYNGGGYKIKVVPQ